MTAISADLPPAEPDPLDPARILRALPERERAGFLAQYQRAVDGARDPEGWGELRQLLRLWAFRAIAVAQPGYYEARERARSGDDSGGALLDDAIAAIRAGR